MFKLAEMTVIGMLFLSMCLSVLAMLAGMWISGAIAMVLMKIAGSVILIGIVVAVGVWIYEDQLKCDDTHRRR